MKEKLTATAVKYTGSCMYGDGLWLRVVIQERRNRLFCYQRQGNVREMGFGPFPAAPLRGARQGRWRRSAPPGAAERNAAEIAEARATTLAEVCGAYVASGAICSRIAGR